MSEKHTSADDVVRETGWVFNNAHREPARPSPSSSPAGDHEVLAYLRAFRLRRGDDPSAADDGRDRDRHRPDDGAASPVRSARWSRATSTPRSSSAAARPSPSSGCPSACARARRRRAHAGAAADSADLMFSYITLQHCHRDDALALAPRRSGSLGPAARSRSTSGHLDGERRCAVAARQGDACHVAAARRRPVAGAPTSRSPGRVAGEPAVTPTRSSVRC